MSRAARTVFVAMLREEWRLHARLFGGVRFGAFPLLVASLGAGAAWLLVAAGTGADAVVAGLHGLALVFGLHTGTIGFVGRDAIRNVLGDVTLLVFTSRTLPASPRGLVAVFLAKDVVYYAALFLLPLSVAVAAVAGPGHLLRLPLLWLTVTGTFLLGALITFATVGLGGRRAAGTLVLLAGGLVAGRSLAGVDPVGLTPYGLYRSPGLASAAAGFLPLVLVAGAGLAVYDPADRRRSRTAGARFAVYRGRLRDADGLLTKSLLDVSRSSGGLWKVAFSGGVLFAVAAFFVGVVERLTGVPPSTGVSFGALLGLTAFTSYNWLTQFDSPDAYRGLPLSTGDVLRAKFRAFLVIGVPTATGLYVLAAAAFGGRPGELLAGGVLGAGVVLYLFGLTVAVTGVEPNEFLFDTARFAAFAGAMSLGLVPALVVGFALVPLGTVALAGVTLWGVALAAVGAGLFRRSVPRWTARYRRGR